MLHEYITLMSHRDNKEHAAIATNYSVANYHRFSTDVVLNYSSHWCEIYTKVSFSRRRNAARAMMKMKLAVPLLPRHLGWENHPRAQRQTASRRRSARLRRQNNLLSISHASRRPATSTLWPCSFFIKLIDPSFHSPFDTSDGGPDLAT